MKERDHNWFDTVTKNLLLTTVAIIVVGVLLRWLGGLANTPCLLRVEFAGSQKAYDAILGEEACKHTAVVSSLGHDVWFIVAYMIGLWLLCMIGARAFMAGAARSTFKIAAWCAVVAGIFDLAEDGFLKYALDQLSLDPKPKVSPDWAFLWAKGMALVKFVALLPVAAVTAVVVIIVAIRLVTWVFPRASSLATHQGDVATKGPVTSAWKDNYRLPPGHRPNRADLVGVCLSGGGIRAATFSMGAFQSLAKEGVLGGATFLTTVSGGGYFGAAYQNLRHLSGVQENPQVAPDRLSVERAFAPGSAEEDHVRRHGKYIADGASQWVGALFVLLRNTVMSLGIVYACLVLAGWGAAYAYRAPKEWGEALFPLYPDGEAVAKLAPIIGTSAAIAVGVPVALALLTWVFSGVLRPKWRSPVQRAAALLAGIGIGVAVVWAVIPELTYWLLTTVNDYQTANGVKATTGNVITTGSGVKIGAFTAVVATATTVWNALAKHLPQNQSGSGSSASTGSKLLSAVGFATRFLLTLAVVIALVALALVVFLAVLHNALVDLRAGGRPWVPMAAAVVLLLLIAFFDQTRMSLHPFYKARLASAFAVQLKNGVAVQPPYEELSTLSDYGSPLQADGRTANPAGRGLRLVLCAAAHVSGSEFAPPGRRVVPFVFSSDFIGSPKLGYFPTAALENAVKRKPYASDVTLTAASAISGAAFASSMGRSSGPMDIILALSNARLGAWLPNPRHHDLSRNHPEMLPAQDRDRSALPKVRRLGYFAREVFGAYPADNRFVYVTDGGHYENLGLVELLRRRCKTIYCVDASGDHSLAFALAEAAALAYEELGVTIWIDGFELATMSAKVGDSPNADLSALHQRLSKQSVVHGTFRYPPGLGEPGEGTLIVGKATLGEDLKVQDPKVNAPHLFRNFRKEALVEVPEMFQVKSYAVNQKEFPGDTTADQWFEVDQFQGYLTLGRLVGEQMSKRPDPS
jgi:hypothetical protein